MNLIWILSENHVVVYIVGGMPGAQRSYSIVKDFKKKSGGCGIEE